MLVGYFSERLSMFGVSQISNDLFLIQWEWTQFESEWRALSDFWLMPTQG
jgi:hypothetical protein